MHAADGHCDPGDLGTFHFADPDPQRWLFVFWVKSITKTFEPAQSFFDINESEAPSRATFTVTVSKQFSISTGVTFTESQTEEINKGFSTQTQLQFNVATMVSTTTTVGASRSEDNVAMGRIDADYGVERFQIVYDYAVYHKRDCWLQGFASNVVATAPSALGWRARHSPNINLGGVVNGVTYRTDDIRAGPTVAIFGQFFVRPDTVSVSQGGVTYEIGDGSPWWYDSPRQINATLPSELQPGWADVTVRASNRLHNSSNTRSIYVQP